MLRPMTLMSRRTHPSPAPTAKAILEMLESLGTPSGRASMERFGIPSTNAHGINTPTLKALARKIGRNHALALDLWDTGVFEARALAAMVADPAKLTRSMTNRWARDLDSWGICDACCCYLFRKTPFAWERAVAWSSAKPEFTKRAGFAMMAYLAIHDKQAADARFIALLPILEREAGDERLFVKKAVNWALRQIGKRNPRLRKRAIACAERIHKQGTASARWIASDALRELKKE
jgi:3-methyladenine DNA glycosylase AlkD